MKYHYDDSAIITSDNFELSDYINRDRLRESKKADKSDDLSRLRKLIQKEDIKEVATLFDLVSETYPELRETLVSEFYVFKTYLDSRRSSKLDDDISKAYSDYKELEIKYQDRFESFQMEMQEKLDQRDSMIMEYEKLLAKLIKTPETTQHFKELQKEFSAWIMRDVECPY